MRRPPGVRAAESDQASSRSAPLPLPPPRLSPRCKLQDVHSRGPCTGYPLLKELSVFLQVGVLKYRPRRGRRAVSCRAYLLLLHAAAGQRDFEALGSLTCAELRAWVCFRTGCQPPSSFRGMLSRVMRSLGPLRFLKCGGRALSVDSARLPPAPSPWVCDTYRAARYVFAGNQVGQAQDRGE